MSRQSERLQEARALVARGPCYNAFARDHSGAECSPTAVNAVRWCALGALARVHCIDARVAHGIDDATTLMLGIERVLPEALDIADANDRFSHEELLRAFDEAIDGASASESS